MQDALSVSLLARKCLKRRMFIAFAFFAFVAVVSSNFAQSSLNQSHEDGFHHNPDGQ